VVTIAAEATTTTTTTTIGAEATVEEAPTATMGVEEARLATIDVLRTETTDVGEEEVTMTIDARFRRKEGSGRELRHQQTVAGAMSRRAVEVVAEEEDVEVMEVEEDILVGMNRAVTNAAFMVT
jgi:hypothetical protein